MVVTNDEQRAEKLRCLRAHGSKPKYYHQVIGGNFRLDALQAAVVCAKLGHLDDWTAARQRNAERYNRLFAESGLEIGDTSHSSNRAVSAAGAASRRRFTSGSPRVFLPKTVANRHIFNQYVIRVSPRDELRSALEARGVSTEVYYPVPMHLQECFSSLGHQIGAFPESESAAKETVALPIYPELTDQQARLVAQCVRDFFSTCS